MRRARQLLATFLIAVSCGGCAAQWPWARLPAAHDQRGVALIVDGPAFERPEVARRVREAVEQASGRHVVVIDAEASSDAEAVKTLAARLRKANPSIASYDWRERRCRSAGLLLTSLARDV